MCGPERESEREARSKLSPPPPSRPGLARRAPPELRMRSARRGGTAGGRGQGGPRDTKHILFSLLLLFMAFLEEFGTKERRMDLGTGTGGGNPRGGSFTFLSVL